MPIPSIRPFLSLALGAVLSSALYAEPLKAVAWNIEWFPGGRPNASKGEKYKQIKGVKGILGTMDPDIFLAQEVQDEKVFGKLVASVPGLKVDVFSAFPDRNKPARPGPQQCAIASKLKANSAWFETFKPAENLPSLSRGFAFAALQHPDGGLIMIYSVHLKSNHGSDTPKGEKNVADTRKESARQIIAHKAEMEKKFAGEKIVGWVVGGDFNTNHDGQFPMCTAVADLVKAGFHNSWDTTPKEERLSWRNHPKYTRFKPTTFDYLMTTGFKETQAKMIPDVSIEISDHAPIEILLEKK
ncbi:MAG: endonuclease/exonuclease/phosphatase family protein [Verrucomicrobia bacterium]|nr:endonuclease/exonuclease/phosphatase family protein [Verrucomicrobiota bacterium]